jgi:hypothetical protein
VVLALPEVWEQGIEDAGGRVVGESGGGVFAAVLMAVSKGSNYTSRADVAFTQVYDLVNGIVRP